jgi:hypothetical protein
VYTLALSIQTKEMKRREATCIRVESGDDFTRPMFVSTTHLVPKYA